MLPTSEPILFTRQRHEAKRAGTHYDIRFVVGDKAYSFATRKDLPEQGSSIVLYEQPVHTAHRSAREAPAFMPRRDSAAREACHVVAFRIITL